MGKTVTSEQLRSDRAQQLAFRRQAFIDGDFVFWTGDISRALRGASQMNAGTVSVNSVDRLRPQTPFGGVRQSGVGRDLSLHALDEFTALKTTWIAY